MTSHSQAAPLVYVGSYTSSAPNAQGASPGITRYHLDPASGSLTDAGSVDGLDNPSHLTLGARRDALHAVEELAEGRVAALARGAGEASFTLLNRQPSGGADPAHLSLDREERWLFAANYSSGSIVVLPVGADGALGASTAWIQHAAHAGQKVNRDGPHAHWIGADPSNRFVLVADLGLDAVFSYRFDAAQGTLAPNDPPFTSLKPGAGPRHLAFRPDGRYVYVINEIDSTIVTCAYDAARGQLHPLQSLSTLPEGYAGEDNTTAAVRVAPSGRFVYGSNRGHDSIAIFACDAESGLLTPLGHEPTQGRTPRDFAIDPTGTFLLAANQESDTIVTFRVDPATGRLAATGSVTSVVAPVCIAFAPSS